MWWRQRPPRPSVIYYIYLAKLLWVGDRRDLVLGLAAWPLWREETKLLVAKTPA